MNGYGQNEKKSTLKDVARKVGRSVATVSMVLNQSAGCERISEETRQLILAAAEELNYQPHYMAQALKKRNTMLVALAVPNIYHPFTPQLIGGVQDALRERGYHLLLLDLTNSPDAESVRTVLQLESGGIDGLIIHSMSKELGPVVDGKLPVVYLDEKSVSPAVWFDAGGATRTLTQHFLQQGIQKIGYIGTFMEPETYTEREKGYRDAMAQAGIPVNEEMICHVSPQLGGGGKAFAWFQGLKEKPEALVVFTDNVAHALMLQLIRAGVRIPEDVALASVDDVEISALMNPPLTCAWVPAYEMGKRAAYMMMEQIAGKDLTGVVETLTVELHIRASSIRSSPTPNP